MKTITIPLVKNKSVDTSNVNNYRPVVALVTFALTIFKIILLELLTPYLDNTIKFGFKKGHSTYHYIFAIKMLFSSIKVTIAQSISAFWTV